MSEGTAPAISVIVPTRNEHAFIRRCVESILADEPPGGIEVIVVDGLSDDGTDLVVREIARTDPRVRILRNPSRFVPQAMNIGIEAARAPFIGRVDGHCLVMPGYFAGCLARLSSGVADAVGGRLVNRGGTAAGRAIAAATSSPVGVGSASFRTGLGGEAFVDTLAFGVYRRDVFDRIGLFDESLVRNQDDELNLRLTLAGGRILLVPSLKIEYFVRDSLAKLWRQYYQYGYWKWRVFRKHRRAASLRQIVPSLFVVALVTAAAAAAIGRPGRIALIALVCPYAAVVSLEALRMWVERKVSWWRTAVALVTLHLSYGAGLLRAIADAAVSARGRAAPPGPSEISR